MRRAFGSAAAGRRLVRAGRSLAVAAGLALALSLPGTTLAAAADGNLSFGTGNNAAIFSHINDEAFAVAVQPDGKTIAAGHSGGDFALTRYNPDGSLDSTFGPGGRVTTDFGSQFESANGVAVQPDGKIVAVGRTGSGGGDFALARYNTNGDLDSIFDTDGRVTTDFSGQFESANGVAVQPDGKIVAVGRTSSGGGDFALARYNTNGSLDTTFDTDGRVTTDFNSGYGDEAHAVAVQADGKIIAAGTGWLSVDFVLMRYNPDGSLDTSFGPDGNGKLFTDFGSFQFSSFDTAFGVAVQTDGKIVAAGHANSSNSNTGSRFALARYNTNGSLDPTFDTDGKVTTDFTNGIDLARGVALQADGRIVAAGSALFQGFALARYNTDGSLDTGFDTDGKVTTLFMTNNDGAWGVAVQADAKIVAVGRAGDTGNFALARYNTDGSLDASFDSDGKVTTDFGHPDLSVAKTGPDTVSLGDTVSYTLTVTNNSTMAATQITVQDILDGPGEVVSAEPSEGTCPDTSATTATCVLDTLAPGAEATVTVVVEPTATGTLTNTATVSSADDPILANNTATVTTTVDNAHGCTIVGTSRVDRLSGTGGRDVICALGGDDTVRAHGGDDTVYAGPGNDSVNGGAGNDTLIGGSGSDTLTGGPGSDSLDTVDAVSGNDTANGGPGTDTCTTDPGDTVTRCP
ncbi:calcium-binding protein [Streptomyces sp. ISL-43]|uniref:calcium-binding protein n=1 Tax=Streptomyces sp. ISL-43 TaxID=2819183 RepID=UPI0027E3BF9D|nr:calcium-binding protein [Streptomyces sp. ISL-43]